MANGCPTDRVRASRTVAAAVAAAAFVAGCSSGAADPDSPGLHLRLVIPDGNVREPDVPCAGARAYRYAHPEAAFVIEDMSGQQVTSGVLPEGRAERAFTVDLGTERQPTVCVMMIDVTGVDSLDGHVLVIEDREPVPIGLNPNLGNVAEAVLQ